MAKQPTNKKVDSKGNLYFNKYGLAWFGLSKLREEPSYSVSPFVGWGEDVLPREFRHKEVPKKEFNERHKPKTVRKPRDKRPRSEFYEPNKNPRKTNIVQLYAGGSWMVQMTLFGSPSPTKFLVTRDKLKAQRYLEECLERRSFLYSTLNVKRGHKDADIVEYVKTGDKDIYTKLFAQYGKPTV